MKMKMKTSVVLDAFNVLNTAKYTKLDDADKIKVWKIARAMKPIATQFESDNKDAAEKMKPEGFDEKIQNAQEYERVMKDSNADASGLKMGAAEYNAFIRELQDYNKLVGEAVKDYADKEVKIEFDTISEEVFGKLMASNEWDISQTMKIEIIVG